MVKIIATIYGPVGHVEQDEGQIRVIANEKWAKLAEEINEAIAAGKAFICNDAVPRRVGKEVGKEDIETLSTALGDGSQGELFLVPAHPI